MTAEGIAALLEDYKEGRLGKEDALDRLRGLGSEELGFATLDTQRRLRQGYPEVVFAEGKSPGQLKAIIERMLAHESPLLATRVKADHFEALRGLSPELRFDEVSRTVSARALRPAEEDSSYVAVVTAGTSDVPVAEEAAITVEVFGHRAERIYDVGVAGIHRLFSKLSLIRKAKVVIAVAGMEGALASVLGGLVEVPVIAVPTSIGYGASFQGLAALLTMLNSCSAGVSVVNIDNGFGAGYMAGMILGTPLPRCPVD